MEPLAARPHREFVLAAMALVPLVAGFGAWMMFKPSASDAGARVSATESGLTVADDIEVESINGVFRLFWTFASDVPAVVRGFSFDIVETAEVSAPVDLSMWEPKIAGATAESEGEPPIRVLIDPGEHSWIVTPGRPWAHDSDESTRHLVPPREFHQHDVRVVDFRAGQPSAHGVSPAGVLACPLGLSQSVTHRTSCVQRLRPAARYFSGCPLPHNLRKDTCARHSPQ